MIPYLKRESVRIVHRCLYSLEGLRFAWRDEASFPQWVVANVISATLACLIGAAILIFSGIGSWRIMLGCLIGMVGLTGLLNLLVSDAGHYASIGPSWHLVVGSFAFGSIFMATDPVTSAMTDTGRWIYGVLIGFMAVLIRVVNPAFPEGIMLAILFANLFAPLMDHFVVQANIKRRLARVQ